jgi:type IV pilus assembly protein PilA
MPAQTARAALIDMFFSKTPGTFVKHLPAVTLAALQNGGAVTTLQQYSLLAGQFQTQGKTFETYETGSVLLAATDPQAETKFEITVENDSLQGEEDNIEVSFRTYKNNQPQRAAPSFLPRITFAMKMESGVWKLNEILVTLRLPLADPDFLKSVAEATKSRNAVTAPMPSQKQISTTTFGTDASILAAMRTILAAENTYSQTYPAVGYTCTLSDLDGFGGGEANEHQAMLIPSGLAGGRKSGYVFTLSGCTGTPASSFHLVASPAGNSIGRRTFCSEQTGAIRYSADGNPATCLASGSPAQ